MANEPTDSLEDARSALLCAAYELACLVAHLNPLRDDDKQSIVNALQQAARCVNTRQRLYGLR